MRWRPGEGLAQHLGEVGRGQLAVTTRACLGHTGEVLTASGATQAIYLAIVTAAIARICAALHPAASDMLLHIAGFAWIAAFFGFALVCGPLLLGSCRRAAERRAPAH